MTETVMDIRVEAFSKKEGDVSGGALRHQIHHLTPA